MKESQVRREVSLIVKKKKKTKTKINTKGTRLMKEKIKGEKKKLIKSKKNIHAYLSEAFRTTTVFQLDWGFVSAPRI